MNDHNGASRHEGSRRTDPVLGNLDQLDTGPDRRGAPPARERVAPPPFNTREHTPPRPHRHVPWLAIGIVVVLAVAGAWAWNHQSTLSALLPQTQLNSLLARADQAYAAGKLTGGPDSARDLYTAARALDPDSQQALTGLHNVGQAELAQARAALQRGDYDQARAALEDARSLLGGGAGVEEVDHALAKAVLNHANSDVLIDQARAALANGRIDGSDGAAALFGKVLAGDPRNPVARHGMTQIGDLLSQRIQAQLGKQDRAGARQTLARLAALLQGYSQLPSLRASIASADRAADAQRDQAIASGQAYLRAGRITGAGNDNAEAQFKAALAADPGNAAAQAGLGQVAEALVVQANAALDAGHVQGAKALLNQAAALAPKSADLAAARSRLAAGAAAPAASGLPVAPVLKPADSAKLARLLARAKAAARRGDIMLPPGNSAYDLYRAALGIDGDNAEAQAGLRALPQVTRDQFRAALRRDDLDHARDMLATLEQLDPGDPTAAGMRHDLGSAWIDRADHYVELGELGPARAALDEARRLVPQDPRLGEVDARIHRNG